MSLTFASQGTRGTLSYTNENGDILSYFQAFQDKSSPTFKDHLTRFIEGTVKSICFNPAHSTSIALTDDYIVFNTDGGDDYCILGSYFTVPNNQANTNAVLEFANFLKLGFEL